ncbi:hypothetical protein JCM15519_16910 [Fundidesulfovibrio butyratiphilus]
MHNVACLVLACALLCGGCAGVKPSPASTPVLTASDAVTQLAGSTMAIASLTSHLPSTGPTAADADTVAHIEGYAAWASVALQALSLVVKAAGM